MFKNLGNLCRFYLFLIGTLNLGIEPLLATEIVTENLLANDSSNKNGADFYTVPSKSHQKSPSQEPKIKIEGFIFKGNTVFTKRELFELVKSYIGKNLSFDEILKIRSLVTNFYNREGYITIRFS